MATEAKKFSKSQAFKFGWQTTRKNLGFFIVVVPVAFSIIFIPNFIYIQNLLRGKVLLTVAILTVVLSGMMQIGLIKITLKFCDNQKARFVDLFSGGRLLLLYLIGSLMYMLIFLGGLILLIVPGIIWLFKFAFFVYFIVDQGIEPSEALRRSAIITQGAKRDLFVFWLLLLLINLAGAAAFFIGLLVTLPLTLLANAFVYRTLLNRVKIR